MTPQIVSAFIGTLRWLASGGRTPDPLKQPRDFWLEEANSSQRVQRVLLRDAPQPSPLPLVWWRRRLADVRLVEEAVPAAAVGRAHPTTSRAGAAEAAAKRAAGAASPVPQPQPPRAAPAPADSRQQPSRWDGAARAAPTEGAADRRHSQMQMSALPLWLRVPLPPGCSAPADGAGAGGWVPPRPLAADLLSPPPAPRSPARRAAALASVEMAAAGAEVPSPPAAAAAAPPQPSFAAAAAAGRAEQAEAAAPLRRRSAVAASGASPQTPRAKRQRGTALGPSPPPLRRACRHTRAAKLPSVSGP